ncbi:MAG: right-handed parallel beta-helix repeat-containing protein, partial [Chitinophagales bacterium]|nr:right-handed parallel beta-helix repeat-containing protein [Chitinophagales bacterium]
MSTSFYTITRTRQWDFKPVFFLKLACFILGISSVDAQVTNVNTAQNYSTLQSAVDAASVGDVLRMDANLSEGLVTVNKAVTIDGNGFTLSSTSVNWGLHVASSGISITGLTLQNAGTFGIITGCGADMLSVTNTTVTNCGGSGFALNGSDNLTLTSITSTNNDGNGVSISDCNNVTINGLTTSGNAFPGGFSAGVGIFSEGDDCPPAGTSNVSITGTVSIAEPVPVYEQVIAGSITGTSVPASVASHFTAVANAQRYYMSNLANAYTVAASLLAAPFSTPVDLVHVEEVSSGDKYVNDLLAPPPPQIGTYTLSINAAITYAQAGKIVHIEDGTYNQRVTVTKSVTLAGQTEAGTVLNGTGLGLGKGISISSGVTDVTIQDLTVQNYSGSSGNADAGIYGNGGNNHLTVQRVTIQNNVGGSGFYANGPVDYVTINDVTSSGHTVGARGIVIWNGLKSHITITNCEVFNNNCCGIELQDGSASGVTMSNNNVHDNGDSGMSAVGLNGSVGSNLISDNTVTNNGRFGIEIKNPNGSSTVSGNTVSRTLPIGAEARDLAGIAVFRRGVLAGNVDVPNGVTVSSNIVSGFEQPSSSEGFGIVIEGLNHTVSGNTVTGCDVGLQQQAGHTPYPGDGNQNNIADEYFGRGNTQMTCGNTISGNSISGNVVNTRDKLVGGGIVTNTTTNEQFCAIQPAIDDAETLAGHTLAIQEGAYVENVDGTLKAVSLSPGNSPGCVTISGNLTLNAGNTLVMEVLGATACTGYDQFVVNGVVTLNGAVLDLSLSYGLLHNDQIMLIQNDGTDDVVGKFAQGNSITVGGDTYYINYKGGTGNDVVLSRVCADVCGGAITYTGTIIISTQTQLNNFKNAAGCKYTSIVGSLTLDGNGNAATAADVPGSDPILDLCNLQELVSVSGNLVIRDFNLPENPDNLSDLGKLTTVGGAATIGSTNVNDNNLFGAINLPVLSTVNTGLTVVNNTTATSLSLGALTAITSNDINITDNVALQTIAIGANGGLTIARDFLINGNDATMLSSISSTVTSVGRNLTFDNNNMSSGATITLNGLTSVGGYLLIDDIATGTLDLPVLHTVTTNIYVRNNDDGLLTLKLPALTTGPTNDVLITNNNVLETINTTGSNFTVGRDLNISANNDGNTLPTGLSTVNLSGLTQVTRDVIIANTNRNTAGADVNLPNLVNVGRNFRIEQVANRIQASASGLTVGGYANIDDNNSLCALDLSGLVSVAQYLAVTDNYDACGTQSVNLTNLQTVGTYLYVTGNDDIPAVLFEDLTAVNGLDASNRSIDITNNDLEMTSVAFPVLNTALSGEFRVNGNANLGAISAPQLPSVGEDFRLEDNNLVSTIDFSALTTVTGVFNLDDEDLLTDLTKLPVLSAVNGNMSITNNAVLTSLDGMGSLVTVGGALAVTGNVQLGQCCVIPCQLTSISGVPGPFNPGVNLNPAGVSISGNKSFVTGGRCVNRTGPNDSGFNVAKAACAVTITAFTHTENSGLAPDDADICSGASITFTVTASSASGNLTYLYFIDKDKSATLTGGDITLYDGPDAAFTYDPSTDLVNLDEVRVIATNSGDYCSATSEAIAFTVNELPVVASIDLEAGSACAGGMIDVTATIANGTPMYTYSWTVANGPGNGTFNTNSSNPTIFTGTTAGDITLQVVVTDAKGCSATGTELTEVTPTGNNCGPTVFAGNKTINTQAEMDAFLSAGCKYTEVTGSLTLNGNSATDPITNFCNLSELQKVGGVLTIRRFTDPLNPSNLGELANLQMVGNGVGNDNLVIGGSVADQNTAFSTIELAGLASVGNGGMTIAYNPGVTQISMPLLTVVGNSTAHNLTIQNNGTAVSSIQLPVLATVGGDVSMNNLVDHTISANINLGGLTTIGDDMNLTRTAASVNLAALQSVDAVTVTLNAGLTTLQANALATATGAMAITNNLALTSIAMSTPFAGNTASLTISGNTALITIDLGVSNVTGNLTVSTNGTGVTQIDLDDLLTVGGSVTMSNNAANAVNAAVDLSKLISVGNDVNLTRTAGTLNLNALQTVTDVFTLSTNSLPSLIAPVLAKVGGAFTISANTSLTNIDIPTPFTSSTASLSVTGNTTLATSNIGLKSTTGNVTFNTNGTAVITIHLPELTSVGGNLVMNNGTTSAVNADIDLSKLGSVTGNMQLTRTAATISGDVMTSVGGNFVFTTNNSFVNLDEAFPNFETVGGNLTVQNNTMLGTCCIIPCKLTVGGTKTVSGNTGNCATLTAATTACGLDEVGGPVPTASTVACLSEAVAPTLPVVKDGLGNVQPDPVPVISDSPDPLTCNGIRTYTYTYDGCPNLVFVWSYTYTIETQHFTVPAPQGSTVACAALAVQPTPPAVNDNCGNLLTPAGPVQGGTYAGCEGTITYTWTYTDCEQNTHNWTYTYTIEVEDFTVPAPQGSTVACAAQAVQPTPPAVNDNCGNPLTPAGPVQGGTYAGCEGTITYTWTYTDCEQN